MHNSIETERLILRRWCETDIPAMAAINQDPLVMQHFPAVKTYAETEKFVRANIQLHESGEYCLYAVKLKSDNTLIGFVGLLNVDLGLAFQPAVEILWRFSSNYWGQGYAYEAAAAVRDYAFNELGLKELVSFTVPANVRSINLMQKLGFIHEAALDFEHPKIEVGNKLRSHVFFRLKNIALHHR